MSWNYLKEVRGLWCVLPSLVWCCMKLSTWDKTGSGGFFLVWKHKKQNGTLVSTSFILIGCAAISCLGHWNCYKTSPSDKLWCCSKLQATSSSVSSQHPADSLAGALADGKGCSRLAGFTWGTISCRANFDQLVRTNTTEWVCTTISVGRYMLAAVQTLSHPEPDTSSRKPAPMRFRWEDSVWFMT